MCLSDAQRWLRGHNMPTRYGLDSDSECQRQAAEPDRGL
jgi:hypothetical protein